MLDKKYTLDDEFYYTIIRDNIRKFRTEQGYTQQNVADMIGMSREYVTDIENESRNKHLTITTLGRIAEVLEKDITDFFR